MRTFKLERKTDITGISGTGTVAEGVVFSDGTTVIRWSTPGNPQSTVIWPNIEAVLKIHGHDGATKVVYNEESN